MKKPLKGVQVFIFFIMLSWGIFYCGNQRKESHNPGELHFEVNPAFLDSVFNASELDLSFSPPAGCKPLPQEIVTKALNRLQTNNLVGDSLSVKPEYFFFNDRDWISCVLSKLVDLENTPKQISQYQKSIFQEFEKRGKVEQGQFYHRQIHFFQTLIITENQVVFKLFIPRQEKKSVQFDYIIPKAIYIEKIKAIESSIGSITFSNNVS